MSKQDMLPEHLRKQLTGKLLFSFKTDLLPDGRFGEQWIAVTSRDIMIMQMEGPTVMQLSAAELKDARAVGAVGGGTLVADMQNGPVVIARYTAELTSVAGFLA